MQHVPSDASTCVILYLTQLLKIYCHTRVLRLLVPRSRVPWSTRARRLFPMISICFFSPFRLSADFSSIRRATHLVRARGWCFCSPGRSLLLLGVENAGYDSGALSACLSISGETDGGLDWSKFDLGLVMKRPGPLWCLVCFRGSSSWSRVVLCGLKIHPDTWSHVRDSGR